jgi:hypothetical protein
MLLSFASNETVTENESKSFVSFMTQWISPGTFLCHDRHKRKYLRSPFPGVAGKP